MNTNKLPKISFVILTWNSEKNINACVNSYAYTVQKENLEAEFFIVDNGSLDSTLKKVNSEIIPNLPLCCSLKIIALKKNYGTTISRNIALRQINGDFIIICDSDTELKSGQLKEAIQFLERNTDVGILAPHLCYANGDTQNSVRKFPILLDKFINLWRNIFKLSIRSSNDYEYLPWSSIKKVDTAISAFWMFSKNTLKLTGMLDEKIFYSPEDVDYCLRIWKCGKSIVFYPNLMITHYTQHLSRNRPFSKQSISHLVSLFYFFYKHKYIFSRKRLRRKLKISYSDNFGSSG